MMLIQNALLWEEGDARRREVLIEQGRIVRIAPSIDTMRGEVETIDAQGRWLLPGIVDLNVALRDATLSKPNLDALLAQMRRGGVTTALLRDDFTPSVDTPAFIQMLRTLLDAQRPRLLFGVRAVSEEGNLHDIAILLKEGACVLQEYSWRDSNLLRRIMEYAQMKGVPLFCYPENPSLSAGGVMHEGEISFRLGIPGIPEIAEISEVAKILAMSRYYGIHTHLQSLSTLEAVRSVVRAKEEGARVSCELSIHHLLLDDSACEGFNTSAKLQPPLRDAATREGLIAAVQEGHIDLLTALHSPRSVLYKDLPFAQAADGIDALELFLPLCYTYLVREGLLEPSSLMRLVSERPAQILGLERVGRIEEGYAADLILFDPEFTREVTERTSPYFGRMLQGRVTHTIAQGALVWSV